MGRLTDLYKQCKDNVTALEKKAMPDKVTQTKEYLDQLKAKRKADRKLHFIETRVQNYPFSRQQMEAALKQAIGEERMNEVTSGSHLDNSLFNLFRSHLQEHPELLPENLKTQQEKTAFLKNKYTVLNYVTDQKNAGKFPTDVYDKIWCIAMHTYAMKSIKAEETLVYFEELEANMPPEAAAQIADEVEAYKDIIDTDISEQYTYPKRALAQQLIQNAPDKYKDDEEYKDLLTFAGDHITGLKDNARDECKAQEKDHMDVENAASTAVTEGHMDKFMNGELVNFSHQHHNLHNDYVVINKGKEKTLETLFQKKITLSDQTKEGLRLMLNKMKEMNMKADGLGTGEDLNKEYAYRKLIKKQKAMEAAMESGNADQILAAGREYKKTYEDMQQLHQIAEKYFSKDEKLYPGNMDSIRNPDIPTDMTTKFRTTSQINAVFLIYRNLELNNIEVEDYLKDPTGSVVTSTMENMKPYTFTEVTRNLNFKDSVDLFFAEGEMRRKADELRLHGPIYGFARAIVGPSVLEADPTLQADNLAMAQTIANHVSTSMMLNEIGRLHPLEYVGRTHEDLIRWEDTIRNLLVVKDEDRNLNAMIAGLPQLDMYGREIGPSLDGAAYIKNHKPDYLNIIERSDYVIKTASRKKEKVTSLALVAVQKTYLQVLMNHPEDMGTEGYHMMANKLASLYLALPEDAKPEQKEYMKATRDAFLKDYAPEILQQEEARSIDGDLRSCIRLADEATRNVHLGSSEYSKAQKDLESLSNAYTGFLKDRDDNDLNQNRAAIRDLQAKIAAAKGSIGDYYKRKQRQNKMGENADEKSKRRISAMKKNEEVLGRMEALLKAEDKRYNWQQAANSQAKLLNQRFKSSIENGENQLQKNSAQGAMDAVKVLNELSFKEPSALSPQEQQKAREALAAISLDELLNSNHSKTYNALRPQNKEGYREQIKTISQSEEFKKCLPPVLKQSVLREFAIGYRSFSSLAEDFHKEGLKAAQNKLEHKNNGNNDLQNDNHKEIKNEIKMNK